MRVPILELARPHARLYIPPQMQFAFALIASFLPSRQRRRWGLEGSALLERSALCGALAQAFWFGYLFWIRFAGQVLSPQDASSPTLRFDLVALLWALLACEGFFRAFIVVGADEIYPSCALVLATWLLGGRESRARNRSSSHIPFSLRNRREDCLEQMGSNLVISTCSLRPEWIDAAVCYAGLFYKAGGPHSGQHGLPYTYILRPWPAGVVIRKSQFYDGRSPVSCSRRNRASER